MGEKLEETINQAGAEPQAQMAAGADAIEEKDQEEIKDQEVCFPQEDVERLLASIAEKNRLHEEMMERLKRLQADFDNFRRRTRQEKDDLSKVVTEGIVLQLLPVLDNFERALSAATEDAAALRAGVEMIYRQFTQALEKMGVQPIEAAGAVFDPQYHEAVIRVEDPDRPDNTVVEVLQKGYMVHGKVIRPSMVKVVSNS
ncbi:GrpE protein [Thermosinus carboxydivorans Nor1]|uniref:Protein GrpE n=1 Tax=Thermosinus carboxydivorans Nor1 TaxID=401526 RepID=A1HR09_9FIRM|nr:nucleotide exchange factor GrpE [Thermosinus carboxydivorans]EAX47517.1 GrpE protein [Thermosinus carboxydivorans Nor1]